MKNHSTSAKDCDREVISRLHPTLSRLFVSPA